MGNTLKRSIQSMSFADKNRTISPNHLYPDPPDSSSNPNHAYRTNKVKTTKYNVFTFLPKNLFEQFHRVANLYFVFIVVLNWVPQVNAFAKEVSMIPVVFVLAVTAVKDAFEDYRRYKSDKALNHTSCRIYKKEDGEGHYHKAEWQHVCPGDLVHLSCNEPIPADMILLRSSDPEGVCLIDTANLDGENNLKQRQAIKWWDHSEADEFDPSTFAYEIECEAPHRDLTKFHGCVMVPPDDRIPLTSSNMLLRGCVIRNTDFVEGIVIYAGHESKALLNNRGLRYKRSKLERQINKDVIWCVILLLIMCFLCALGSGVWLAGYDGSKTIPFLQFAYKIQYQPAYFGFVVFWTFIIIFQVMIPLSLYITIELIKLGQVYFIQQDIHLYHEGTQKSIHCGALNITEDLGQVQYVFSDKTGTLTENRMIFKKCSIGGTDYSHTTLDCDSFSGIGVAVNSLSSHSTFSPKASMSDISQYDETIHIDPRLQQKVSQINISSHSGIALMVPPDVQRICDFFLLLVVCNTVVVSPHPHADKMDESGKIISTSPSDSILKGSNKKKLRLKLPTNLFSRFDSSHQVTEDEDGISCAESDTDTSIVSESTLKMRYEAESPDELALVKAACSYGCRLVRRKGPIATLWIPAEGEVDIEILHVLHFDSVRKLMSVIIRHPTTNEIILYCKGADSAILSNLEKPKTGNFEFNSLYQETKHHLTLYAKDGLRTLCMAKRIISEGEYQSWLRQHQEAESAIHNRDALLYESASAVETNLTLIGCTGIEDRLQDGVPETIQSLKDAGMKIWVLTGDKQETALNIAHACNLISFDQHLLALNAKNKEMAGDLIKNKLEQIDLLHSTSHDNYAMSSVHDVITVNQGNRVESSATESMTMTDDVRRTSRSRPVLVIDGKTLGFIQDLKLDKDFLTLTSKCDSLVCVRATPFQKAALIRMVKEKLHKLTLAIGDGANDVSMIQTADIGVGISGKEGMQAVMASDFAIPRFRFLCRLLLVHGHWCYDRLSRVVLYMFYKNAIFIFLLMWYQIFNGFSGSSMVEQFNMIFFNLLYTALPPITLGVFDKDLPDSTLMAQPSLYKQGPAAQIYRPHSYWLCMLDALWQSLALYFVAHLTYSGSNVGLWEYGAVCIVTTTIASNLHLLIETKSWNFPQLGAVGLSIIVMFIFNLSFNALCVACGRQSPYMVMENTICTAEFWFVSVLSVLLALAPRCLIRILQWTLWPSDVELGRQEIKRQRRSHMVPQRLGSQVTTVHYRSTQDELSI